MSVVVANSSLNMLSSFSSDTVRKYTERVALWADVGASCRHVSLSKLSDDTNRGSCGKLIPDLVILM